MTDSFVYDDQLTSAGREADAGPSAFKTSVDAPPSSNNGSTNFSTSLNRWREIQLPDVQANLESLSSSLIEAQKESLLSRKKLAEQTREFRKLTADAQPDAIKPLLKSYQTEIDSLTKRAKTAENSLLSVRDRLHGASDPYPILELVLEQTAVMGDVEHLREQVKRLQSTNASLESQVASLPSIEAERTRLSKRVTQLESHASETRRTIEAELSAKWDERIRNHRAREENLQKSVELAQSQLKELRANYAKATERLLHYGEEVEREETNGKIEELDMLGEELSRSNERAAAMERRNEQLRQEIERLKNGLGEDKRVAELEQRALDAEEEARRLSALIESQSSKAQEDTGRRSARMRELEHNLREKDGEIVTLRKKLTAMADYDEIRRELEIIKFVEFAVESDDRPSADNLDESINHEGVPPSAAKPLEALLIEKNKQLQDEVTGLRVAHNELRASADTTNHQLDDAKSEVERLKKLNERLEDDLLNVNTGQNKSSANMSAEEALAEMDKIGKETASNLSGNARTDVDSQIPAMASATPPLPASSFDGAAKTKAAPISGQGEASANSSSSASNILPIITSQRDRFRARNAELEEELRKQFVTMTELRNEVKTLQNDNLALYEKVRYLQTYNAAAGTQSRIGGSSSSGMRGAMSGSRSVNMTAAAARNDYGVSHVYPPATRDGGGDEDKYRAKYEASMNPFEQFRGREQSRALSALNPLERILHMLTRVVLGHRRARIFFVIYALCLHLLVFAMLFEVEFLTGSATPKLDGVMPAHNGQAPAT